MVLGNDQPSVLSSSSTAEQLNLLHKYQWLDDPAFDVLNQSLDSLTQARHLALLSRQPSTTEFSLEQSKAVCLSFLQP